METQNDTAALLRVAASFYAEALNNLERGAEYHPQFLYHAQEHALQAVKLCYRAMCAAPPGELRWFAEKCEFVAHDLIRTFFAES